MDPLFTNRPMLVLSMVLFLLVSDPLRQSLQQYRLYSQYPITGELRRLLDDVTDDEKMRLLRRHSTLMEAAERGETKMINSIPSSLSPHQRLEVLSEGSSRPLRRAAYNSESDSVREILSHLTSELRDNKQNSEREIRRKEIWDYIDPGQKYLSKKEKLRWIRSLSRRHASGVRALGQLALNSYLTQNSTNLHNFSYTYLDIEQSTGCSDSHNLKLRNKLGQQAHRDDSTTHDGKGSMGRKNVSNKSTQACLRIHIAGNTPTNTTTATQPVHPSSPPDDAKHNQITEQLDLQPADDQFYLLEPNCKGLESIGSTEITSEVVTDIPCTEKCVVKAEELMPLSITMKKSEDEDAASHGRALVTWQPNFTPERVVTPLNTVPRYPDNHNPLLPLALQRRLDEMSPREFLTYVLNELTLEERESLMVDERQRRKTFLVNWPYENQLNGINMAQAGFYSVDDYGRVQCVFCRGSLHCWEQDDVPMLKHARSFAFCRFVKGLNCGNHMTPNRDGSLETDSSALGISTNRAAMVEYAPDASRLNTYNRWPASSSLAAADLCAVGFGVRWVRCFYCAGGIREWSTTDGPWEEHARWFPGCEYVLQKNGDKFVNDVHTRTPTNKKTTRSTKAQNKELKEKEDEQIMVEAMFEECHKFGHDDAVIIAAMKRRGPDLKKISDLIEVIYALEEKGLPLECPGSDATQSITTDSVYLTVPEEDRGRAMVSISEEEVDNSYYSTDIQQTADDFIEDYDDPKKSSCDDEKSQYGDVIKEITSVQNLTPEKIDIQVCTLGNDPSGGAIPKHSPRGAAGPYGSQDGAVSELGESRVSQQSSHCDRQRAGTYSGMPLQAIQRAPTPHVTQHHTYQGSGNVYHQYFTIGTGDNQPTVQAIANQMTGIAEGDHVTVNQYINGEHGAGSPALNQAPGEDGMASELVEHLESNHSTDCGQKFKKLEQDITDLRDCLSSHAADVMKGQDERDGIKQDVRRMRSALATGRTVEPDTPEQVNEYDGSDISIDGSDTYDDDSPDPGARLYDGPTVTGFYCQVCLKPKATCIALPCGHIVFCPTCREEVDKIMRYNPYYQPTCRHSSGCRKCIKGTRFKLQEEGR